MIAGDVVGRETTLALAVVAAFGLVACSPTAPSSRDQGNSPPAAAPGYRLVWQDEFDGAGLDASKWTAQSAVRRDATNTPAAVGLAGGVLTITTYTEGNTHFTGFIDTAGKYEPTYGYIEARIRYDTSPGQWGAFWLQSPTMGTPLGNPAVAGTEVDIAEHRAHDTSGADIANTYVMAVHWDGYGSSLKSVSATGRPAAGASPLAGNFHTYALLWTPDRYVFYLDGIETWRTSDAPSRRSEFIRLTCEVLNRGWAGSIPAGGYGTRVSSTTRMQVDWIRVWQAPGS